MQAIASTSATLRATFNDQGYVLVKNLIPEAIGNRVLEDLRLATTQLLQSRGLPHSGA